MRSIPALLAVALGLTASSAWAAAPVGYLDSAGCDVVAGWAQDPDSPGAPIAVHIYYGGPAGSGAPATPTTASVYRADLCAAIGSCEHGFISLSPLAFHDGQARDVYAYGIDDQGGNNPVLGSAPRTMLCPAEAQVGVRRRVVDLASFDAWRFSSFWDLLPLAAADAGAIPEGPSLSATPELVQSDDGSPDLWLIDGDGHLRRRVALEIIPSWKFDVESVKLFPASQVLALTEGTPLRPRPITIVSGPLYMVDDAQPDAGSGPTLTTGEGGGDASGFGGNGGAAATSGSGAPYDAGAPDAGGCQVGAGRDHPESELGWAAIAALGVGWMTRRRAKTTRR